MEDLSEQSSVFYFILILLVMIVISKKVQEVVGIPISVIQISIGFLCGVAGKNLGVGSRWLSLAAGMDPDLIISIFIPVLLFESAFNTDIFLFKRQFKQVIIIAIVGVVIGTFITGIGLRLLLFRKSPLSLAQFLLIGSICSPTDPIAVISLIKEIGINKKFGVFIEGESLINDGSSMVIYFALIEIFKGNYRGVVQIVLKFGRFACGGVAVGFTTGFLMNQWVKSILQDSNLQILITVLGCYLSYFIAEGVLNASGIISVVSSGIVFGIHGVHQI